MKETPAHTERIVKMVFASVYPHYVRKVTTKGRTVQELHEVIEWLTGFGEAEIASIIERKITFGQLFDEAKLNAKASLIKGMICGFRIEDIQNPLTQKVRYLDKLVDQLAQGKSMEKILFRV